MMQRALGLALLVVLAMPASGQEQAEEPIAVPFTMPLPEGWRNETIPFPLSFAPELPYEGLEELRFAPGMFEAGAEDYWTYAFVWWIPITTSLKASDIGKDLEVYFQGLTRAVMDSKQKPFPDATFAAEVQEIPGKEGQNRRFKARIETFDSFTAMAAVELNARIEILSCPEEKRQAVYFDFSPQPPTHAVWKQLAAIREGFSCSNQGKD